MSDPRFARLKSDPRFRRPKKKEQKVVVDERFKSVFAGEKKQKSKKVDKYGRSVSAKKDDDDLRRYYRLEGFEDQEDAPKRPDYARGQVLLESSDEEEDDKDSDDDDDGIVTLGADSSRPITIPNDDELEIDLDEDEVDALEAQAAEYARTHQDEEEEEEEEKPAVERTRRLAIVNLDWDHVRAHHIYKICSSVVSSTAPSLAPKKTNKSDNPSDRPQVNVTRGKVLRVVVYPSEFGKERIEREAREGPPPEVFRKNRELDPEEITEKSLFEVGGQEDEYDENALRKYQLQRLRYYYAVVECDTVDAASHIYDELEGTELERSANIFDMSFIPDDMEFDGEPRDEANDDGNSVSYKPIDFVTDALRHSKVKLTWDDDDPERSRLTRRALTKQDMEENDFRDIIASGSDESESEDVGKKDKQAERNRLRSLLLSGNEDAMPEGWGNRDDDGDVDMEVTFAPALSSKKSQEDETTLETYQRKMREKRKKRKEEYKNKDAPKVASEDDAGDEFFAIGGASEDEEDEAPVRAKKDKRGKGSKGKAEKESASKPEISAEELALLVSSDNPSAEPKHFSLKAVMKAEKKKGKKSKKGKHEQEDETQEDFAIDVKDERFKALHESHVFAIDPTNPHFKKTKGMTALMQERQKRQREEHRESNSGAMAPSGAHAPSERSLESLVESVKRKSSTKEGPKMGKRQKLA